MIIILTGPPGSGKGTQAVQLAQKLNIPHISTGEIFRGELKNNTPLGQKAKSYMDAGELVPDEVVTDMVKARLQKDDCTDGFILDGFPRTIPQAEGLKEIFESMNRAIDYLIDLRVDDELIIKRLTGRMACENCNKDFNRYTNPPKQENVCDACGGALTSRSDDNVETVKNRLEVYKKETEPILDFYGDAVTPIEGSGTPQETLERVLLVINP
jgi:adenylate kinase